MTGYLGERIPALSCQRPDGSPVAVAADTGRPQLLIFLRHLT